MLVGIGVRRLENARLPWRSGEFRFAARRVRAALSIANLQLPIWQLWIEGSTLSKSAIVNRQSQIENYSVFQPFTSTLAVAEPSSLAL